MSTMRYLFVNIVGTLLRFLPWPCATGLVEIGEPDENSPVLVTCNFRLTVERVRRALRNVDAHLLIANSRGINVWCAATGGRLTNYDVISVLKTSGIAERVRHRRVVLPQLAATGVEARVIEEKSGWQVIWGPVYVKDLPEFLKGGQAKSREMRVVAFPWRQRLEISAAWAFPISLAAGVVTALWWRQALVPAVLVVWGLCLAVLMAFPLYGGWLGSGGKGSGLVLGALVGVWAVAMVCALGYRYFWAGGEWDDLLRWGVLTLVVILLLGVDLLGNTPVYKSGLQEDRRLHVALDEVRCQGVGACEDVCPRDCFEVDYRRGKASMPGSGRCVQCGACIVQCPFDALRFITPEGATISPETIREYKLNLMGRRVER
jgi:ferredoxin